MPFPLLPFAIKGAMIAAKYAAAKPAAAKAAVAVGKAVAAKAGTAAVVTATTSGLVLIGGVAWSYENYERAIDAYDCVIDGDLEGAAELLEDIATSATVVLGHGFTDLLDDWMLDGCPVDSRVIALSKEAKKLAREAKRSGELVDED